MPSQTPIALPGDDADLADRYRFLMHINSDSSVLEKLTEHLEPWYESWDMRDMHEDGDLDASHQFMTKMRDTAIGLQLWFPI